MKSVVAFRLHPVHTHTKKKRLDPLPTLSLPHEFLTTDTFDSAKLHMPKVTQIFVVLDRLDIEHSLGGKKKKKRKFA